MHPEAPPSNEQWLLVRRLFYFAWSGFHISRGNRLREVERSASSECSRFVCSGTADREFRPDKAPPAEKTVDPKKPWKGPQRMADESTLFRQWTLLRLLSIRRLGSTVEDLAREMEVSVKTIRRDLELFRQVGFPIEEKRGLRGKKSWLLPTPAEPQLAFTFDEALALYLGRRFLEPLAGTLFWEACQRAFAKIRASLGKSAIEYLERLAGRIHGTMIGASDYSAKADAIDEIMVAIEDSRQTIITYQSRNATEPVEYAVNPYGLAFHRGSLYLIAHSLDHGEIRHFKLDRLHEVEVSKLPFKRPSDFDVAKHLARSFGVFHGTGDICVRVRFSPAAARYVRESTWHTSQRLYEQSDSGVIAEFTLSATEEIKAWVLSFGKEAEILAPAELREGVAKELERMVSKYGKPSSQGLRRGR